MALVKWVACVVEWKMVPRAPSLGSDARHIPGVRVG